MATNIVARGCLIERCPKKHKALGLCDKHYYRHRVNGGALQLSRRENVPFQTIEDEGFEAYFWTLAQITANPDKCWEWQHSRTKAGYGQFAVGGTKYYAHRFAWELTNRRQVGAGLEVLHSCDNPSCINSNHLSEGTHRKNMQEALERNRMQRGADRHNTHLNDDLVREMRQHLADGKTGRWVAERYGLKDMAVSKIKHRQTWKHVID